MLISVIGAPGSGKGTLLTLLSTDFPSVFSHFSLGDYLRQLLLLHQTTQQQPQQQQQQLLEPHVREQIQKSELLSPRDLVPILKEGLREKGFLLLFDEKESEKAKQKQKEKENKNPILLLDGFPRDISQLNPNLNLNLKGDFLQPDLVLFFDCPREIALQRYVSRGLPGRDVDGNVFEKRFGEFERLNGELVEEFEKRGILIRIDTSRDTETSYQRLLQVLRDSDYRLCKEVGGLEEGKGKEMG